MKTRWLLFFKRIVCFFIFSTITNAYCSEQPRVIIDEAYEEARCDFFDLSTKIKQLVTKRAVKKILKKIDIDRGGNTKKLIETIATSFRDYHDIKEVLTQINEHIGRLIGTKYSSLPKDPNNSIGALLWLKKKKKEDKCNIWLEKVMRSYICSPAKFTKMLSEAYFPGKKEEVFL
jgi:hypothetical protein